MAIDSRVDEAEIGRFLERTTSVDFERLALDLLHQQMEDSRFAAITTQRQPRPRRWGHWSDAPPVPVSELQKNGPPAGRSLVEISARATWRAIESSSESPILLLTTDDPCSREDGLAVDLLAAVDRTSLAQPVDSRGLDKLAVRSWLAARQRAGRSVAIVASDVMAAALLDDLERRRLHFRLPAGSKLIRILPSVNELLDDSAGGLPGRLGLPPGADHRLLTLPSLSSPLVAVTGTDGRPLLPDLRWWVRHRIVPAGDSDPAAGRIAVFDLATFRIPAFQLLDLEGREVDGQVQLRLPVGSGAPGP